MIEKYVKMKRRTVGNLEVFCPIDKEKHVILVGLTLIGFVPKGSEVIGEYDEETDELILFEKK
jgi:hypothetical protein